MKRLARDLKELEDELEHKITPRERWGFYRGALSASGIISDASKRRGSTRKSRLKVWVELLDEIRDEVMRQAGLIRK